jgi:uncharacterized membrane protein YfcA
VFYVYYLQSVKNNKKIAASTWSTAINLSSSLAAIFFVQENWIVIPSCIGSFVGTYLGMVIESRIKNDR